MKNKKHSKEFLKEVVKLCEKYQLSISHEDSHGGFIIEKFSEKNIEWLNDAEINT